MAFIQTTIKVNESSIIDMIDNLIDDKTMLEIHNTFAKMCDPYVPYLNSPLSGSGLAQVTKDYVKYGNSEVPYARYQYYLETDNRTRTTHPRATSFWDRVMMAEQGDVFIKQVEQILINRAHELYG